MVKQGQHSLLEPPTLLRTAPRVALLHTTIDPRTMAPVYSAFAVNKSGHLQVSDVHSIYWEECGLSTGVPIVYLHGGPGGGIEDSDRQESQTKFRLTTS
jgi:hypothetical protein